MDLLWILRGRIDVCTPVGEQGHGDTGGRGCPGWEPPTHETSGGPPARVGPAHPVVNSYARYAPTVPTAPAAPSAHGRLAGGWQGLHITRYSFHASE